MAGFFTDKITSGTQGGTPSPKVYRVQIVGNARGFQGGGRLEVLAQTPEEIGIQIENEWEPLIANGSIPIPGENSSNEAIRVGTTFARRAHEASGISRANQGLTSQIWRGTSPLELQLPLLLNAREDAFRDVVVPIRNLIQLATPYAPQGQANRLLNTFIHAPGPTLLDVIEGRTGNNISVAIGTWIQIPSVVITSLQFDIPNRYTRSGHPVEANVNVVLRTHYTYLRGDYNSIFGFDRFD